MKPLIINNEECRVIDGFERYHISEYGRVYRTTPITNKEKQLVNNGALYLNESKVHFSFKNGRALQGFVSISAIESKLYSIAVAKLVSVAFGIIPNIKLRKNKMIGYRDNNTQNLHYSNLYYTNKINGNGKLTNDEVKIIKKQISDGIPLRHIGNEFGVSEMQINRIKTGENWGNGVRKIKAPKAPFPIKDGKIRKYIATFERKKTDKSIRKQFYVKRNNKIPTDNTIIGILNGYKVSIKHKNITRAQIISKKLNKYFFNS